MKTKQVVPPYTKDIPKMDRFINHFWLTYKNNWVISDAGPSVKARFSIERPLQVNDRLTLHEQVRDRKQGQMYPAWRRVADPKRV